MTYNYYSFRHANFILRTKLLELTLYYQPPIENYDREEILNKLKTKIETVDKLIFVFETDLFIDNSKVIEITRAANRKQETMNVVSRPENNQPRL